jgi:hypothetical protein
MSGVRIETIADVRRKIFSALKTRRRFSVGGLCVILIETSALFLTHQKAIAINKEHAAARKFNAMQLVEGRMPFLILLS